VALAGTSVGTVAAAAPARADSPPPINALTMQPPRTAPIYAYHADHDELIPYSSAHALWSKYCAEGVAVDLRTSFLDDHVSYAVTGAPGAVGYLADRFAGLPAPSNC
jgi:hypothetical protein